MRFFLARLAPLFHRISFTLAVAAASTAYAQTLSKLPADEQPCFVLSQILLDSGTDPLPKGLQEALSRDPDNNADNPTGQCIGAQGVQLLIDRVQNALISQGFVTSRVLAAPQNLQTGTLTLNVFMGKLADIQWADPTDGQFRRAQAWNAIPAQKGDLLNMRDIEQALENFKRVSAFPCSSYKPLNFPPIMSCGPAKDSISLSCQLPAS
jgi:hemolysin activation/secretion protein